MRLFATVSVFVLFSAVHIVIGVEDYVYDIETGKHIKSGTNWRQS